MNYQEHEERIEADIKIRIKSNHDNALNSFYVKEQIGIFKNSNWHKMFTISGALKFDSLEMLGASKKYFTQKEGRFFVNKYLSQDKYILRGPRYITAIDPFTSVPQKLNIYLEDITDGINILKNMNHPVENQYLSISPILDYIKNALVTIYNAYTNREKLGELEQENSSYQILKHELLQAVSESVICFYLSLIDEFNHSKFLTLFKALDEIIIKKILVTIESEFQQFKFSSRSVVRPEASHPLLLAGFAHNLTEKYKDVEVIFGLPSGGTELTCLVHQLFLHRTNDVKQLVLLPISLHSIPKEFNIINQNLTDKFKFLIPKYKGRQKQIKALIVDDNSSTGETIEVAHEVISKVNDLYNIVCCVAEADIIRSKLTFSNLKRNHKVVDPKIYENSISILPISKLIWPKHDLKEVSESRFLYHYYLNKSVSQDILIRIKNEVIADVIENRFDRLKGTYTTENSITSFKDTKLSNFYAQDILYKGKIYPSVEHAYLCQKFNLNVIKNIKGKQLETLKELIRIKGIGMEISDFSKVFYDRKIPSGIVKRISRVLKVWGYDKLNWDEIRMDIMIELQIIKYSNLDLKRFLLEETDNKYLIEGNSWNDTFWGVCEMRGKNFLGRIIMNIREKLMKNAL